MKLTAIAPSPSADAHRIGRQRIPVAREFPGFVNRHLARRAPLDCCDVDRSVQDDVEGKPAVPFLEEHVPGAIGRTRPQGRRASIWARLSRGRRYRVRMTCPSHTKPAKARQLVAGEAFGLSEARICRYSCCMVSSGTGSMNGCTSEVTARVAVGRFVLEIGDPSGAVVREASRTERVHYHPRPTPILVRPRLIRRLLDRRIEVAAALSALDAGLPIELSGEPGIGKTAILRHLAHHARAASFVDGIAYVRARRQPFTDLLQLIFEAFYESDDVSQPTDAEIRRGLRDKQALILLDDVHLTPHELEQVIDIARNRRSRWRRARRCLWGEVRSLALKGLSPEDAVLLFEQELERALDDAERSAAASLCAALEGHPVRILQAAALVRDHGISVDGCARSITPATLIAELLVSLDDKQRRALLALTALPGVPLTAQHVSGIAELPDIEPALRTLARRGLVRGSESRHRLADGVADQLRRTDDLAPWVNRAITYFTAWAERYRRSPGRLLEESEALLAVHEHAADARRWGEVLRVGTLLEAALVTGARWGAWRSAWNGASPRRRHSEIDWSEAGCFTKWVVEPCALGITARPAPR